MNKNIVIIHYNTPYLTECLVRSINLFVKDAIIYIFDNSDKEPFIANFKNVTIFDNTNGQIVNFEEWLENYPKRNLSPGSANNWGSAKHCYSIQKCMDLINENFILLDSDVLLKKDISDLFDEKYMYIGETVSQPNSFIKRVLPFICYINVKMCKENGVNYFDDNYMHGLSKKSGSDSYDTGAGFYKFASKFPHLNINFNDYIIHYGHGSWDKKGEKPKITSKEWTLLNKNLWSNEKNKNVIYTCITGDYDNLIEPNIISENFDYVCFTDNENLKSYVWRILPLPKEVEELTQIKKQRYVKVNSHLLLNDYEFSIWVDGNVEIVGNMNDFIKNLNTDESSIFIPTHPNRTCIYAEERAVIAMKKDTSENTSEQIKRYREENFPKNYGLVQSNIIFRKHNDEKCIKIMNEWWEEIKNGSHRDQLSFNYVSWKNENIKIIYLDKKTCDSKWFKWRKVHTKNKKQNIIKEKNNRPRKTVEQLRADFEKILKKTYKTNDVGIYII